MNSWLRSLSFCGRRGSHPVGVSRRPWRPRTHHLSDLGDAVAFPKSRRRGVRPSIDSMWNRRRDPRNRTIADEVDGVVRRIESRAVFRFTLAALPVHALKLALDPRSASRISLRTSPFGRSLLAPKFSIATSTAPERSVHGPVRIDFLLAPYHNGPPHLYTRCHVC
jgi:hypothetical protein